MHSPIACGSYSALRVLCPALPAPARLAAPCCPQDRSEPSLNYLAAAATKDLNAPDHQNGAQFPALNAYPGTGG
jgi:hypothetical protein